MTRRSYRIYYSSAGLPKGELPLSEEQVARHLENLPTSLHLHFSSSNTEVVTNEASAQEAAEFCVTLVSSDSEAKLDDAIAACVRKLNLATPGLCFLIDRIAQ